MCINEAIRIVTKDYDGGMPEGDEPEFERVVLRAVD